MQEIIFSASGYGSAEEALAAGLSQTQIDITTEYYAAIQALLKEHGLI